MSLLSLFCYITVSLKYNNNKDTTCSDSVQLQLNLSSHKLFDLNIVLFILLRVKNIHVWLLQIKPSLKLLIVPIWTIMDNKVCHREDSVSISHILFP